MRYLIALLGWLDRQCTHLAAELLVKDKSWHTLVCPCGAYDEAPTRRLEAQ